VLHHEWLLYQPGVPGLSPLQATGRVSVEQAARRGLARFDPNQGTTTPRPEPFRHHGRSRCRPAEASPDRVGLFLQRITTHPPGLMHRPSGHSIKRARRKASVLLENKNCQ
jgi:hypothetical protein